MIAEGIETALSAMQATGRTAWAAVAAEPASLAKANKQEPTPEPRRKRKPARAAAVEPTLTA